MRIHSQSGFGHIALVLVVLVFGAIGAIGYTLYANPKADNRGKNAAPVVKTDPRTTEATLNVPAAPQIKTASDLDKAIATLEKVDPGSESQRDQQQIDSQLQGL